MRFGILRFVPSVDFVSLELTARSPALRIQECSVALGLWEVPKRNRAAMLSSDGRVSFLNRAAIASLPGSFWRGLPRPQPRRSGF